MSYPKLLAALFACAMILPAQAQTKKELVQKLLQLQQPGVEAMTRGIVEQPAQQMMQSVSTVIQTRIPAEQREAVGKKVEAAVKTYVSEVTVIAHAEALKIGPSTGPTLEERFSEDELKQIIAWLESPVNKKFSQAMPEIQNNLVKTFVTNSRAAVEPKVKALEQSIRTAIEGAIPPATAPTSGASKPKNGGKPASK